MNLILDKGDEYMDAPPAGWRVKFRDDATLILKGHERKSAGRRDCFLNYVESRSPSNE